MIKRIYVCDRCGKEIPGWGKCLSVYSFCESCWASFKDWIKGAAVEGLADRPGEEPSLTHGGPCENGDGTSWAWDVSGWANRFGVSPASVYRAFRKMGIQPVPEGCAGRTGQSGVGRPGRLYELSITTADLLCERLRANLAKGNGKLARRRK